MTTPSRILRLPAIALVVVFTFFLAQRAMAQNPPAKAASDDGCCWIDAKTGKRVASFPVITGPDGKTDWVRPDVVDRDRAFDPRTGRNFAKDDSGCWIDAKTGKRVASFPVITGPDGKTDWVRPDVVDRDRAFDPKTGRNFVRVPCPPPATTTIPPTPTPTPPVEHASSGVPARLELGLGYSYMHPDAEVVKDLNGFTVAGFYNVNSWLAFGGEFSGLYGTETQNFDDGSVKTSLDRYLYLFGPQVTVHPCDRTRVYGRVLVGGAHDENKISFLGDTWRSSADAFALAVGAGVDVQVTRHFSVGPSFDYVPTHFISPNGNNWQNNWRVGLAGKFSF